MARRDAFDVWPLVHDERAALLADLETLTDVQWGTPSLCDGWSVWDVAAHLVENASTTLPGMLRDLVLSRFNFDRMNEIGVQRSRGETPSEVLASLRDLVRATRTPPVDRASRLVEEIVHGEDIRRPLGIVRHYPSAAVIPALEYLLRTPESVGGAKRRVAGLRLVAIDVGWTCGDDSRPEVREVRARAIDLLMAAAGRTEWP